MAARQQTSTAIAAGSGTERGTGIEQGMTAEDASEKRLSATVTGRGAEIATMTAAIDALAAGRTEVGTVRESDVGAVVRVETGVNADGIWVVIRRETRGRAGAKATSML